MFPQLLFMDKTRPKTSKLILIIPWIDPYELLN